MLWSQTQSFLNDQIYLYCSLQFVEKSVSALNYLQSNVIILKRYLEFLHQCFFQAIPLLKRQQNHTLTMSQEQVLQRKVCIE